MCRCFWCWRWWVGILYVSVSVCMYVCIGVLVYMYVCIVVLVCIYVCIGILVCVGELYVYVY